MGTRAGFEQLKTFLLSKGYNKAVFNTLFLRLWAICFILEPAGLSEPLSHVSTFLYNIIGSDLPEKFRPVPGQGYKPASFIVLCGF
jgi:hypothetical protein